MKFQKRSSFTPSISSPLADDEERRLHDENSQPDFTRKPDTSATKRKGSKMESLDNKLMKTGSAEDQNDDDESDESYDSTSYKAIPLELINRLRTFPLFANAPPAFLSAVGRSLKLIQFHPQEDIVKSGEAAKSMYWILRGSVGVTSTDGESTYAELTAGSFFGEIGILFNRPRTATVVARTKVLLGVLTKESLNTVLPDYPAIERLIRDEGQERLAMQEKRRRASFIAQTVNTPSPSTRAVANVRGNNSTVVSNMIKPSVSSDAVIQSALVPGPSLPGPSLPLMHPSHRLAHLSHIGHSNQPVVNSPLRDNVDDSISVREFLGSLPLFKTLPSDQIHELALSVEMIKCNTFQYVLRKGDMGRDIFFIVSGEVEVVDPSNDNRIFARLGPGKYFGEMAFLSSLSEQESTTKARSADIRAISQCELLVVRGDTLEDLCRRSPLVAEDMKTTAGERLRNNDSVGNMIHSTQVSLLDRITVDSLIAHNEHDEPLFNSISWNRNYEDSGPKDITGSDEPSLNEEDPLSRPKLLPSASFQSSVFSSVSSSSTSMSNIEEDPKFRPQRPALPLSMSSPVFTPQMQSQPQQQMQQFSLSSMDPSVNSLDKFQPTRANFQYTPYAQRLRINSVSGTGRRKSVLSAGPLPDSLLLKIFEYLDLKTLARCASVSRHWKQMVYLASNLCQTLDLTPYSREIDDASLIRITNFVGSRPQVIDISNCHHITDEGFTYMISEIGIRGSIKTLRMRDNWNISAMAIMDLGVPSVGSDLVEIDLANCRKVRVDVIERLVGSSSQSSTLQIGCPKLSKINLSYCKYLTDRTMLSLAENASDRLEELNLTRCTTITDNGFSYWSNWKFPRLRKVVLRDCTFLSDVAITSLATASPNLEELDLTFCCVLSDNAIAILYLCCKNIRVLNLSFCGSAVSDSSLVSLSRLPHLKKLVLTGCIRVTRQGIDTLLSNSKSLRHLDLSQCPRINEYQGNPVEPFEKSPGTKTAYLKVSATDEIVEVVL
ncbi:unnamed protein product [Kuraishia capsulata CBS 1993]|uniref:Cyclic nucleotide-binding domain-containing protein n=1 Tax=Kuraishia capsulata CBS 1993 TaxID=1382522 RepID=W6MHU2_9ASCO|nr:uncharacterized protein KUCA_T00001342001 [Kuraishia capsulata CBS 1993]CDK25373.1 unnamed protein product [Kuraishia capsulata CBS 1993]